MFDSESIKMVTNAIKLETKNARENWGDEYASLQEGYAILKEEIEEATKECNSMIVNLENFWGAIKRNDSTVNELTDIYSDAFFCAMECLQVCAVVNKIIGRK